MAHLLACRARTKSRLEADRWQGQSYQNITYSYINNGQLTQVQGNGSTYKMNYDALGKCVSRTLNGSVTYYYYYGEKPIQERDVNGRTSGSNLHI
jgi:YD repeat-containing protein